LKADAIMFAGNWRIWMLYARTTSLYRMRSTEIRFSVPASSSCNHWKFSLDLRTG